MKTILLAFILILLPSLQDVNSMDIGKWEQNFHAEDADENLGIIVVHEKDAYDSGHSGNGFAIVGGRGSFIQWNVETWWNGTDFGAIADFDISVRYSSPDRCSCSLYVDNIKISDYDFDSTSFRNQWKDSLPIKISLNKGIHQIKIVSMGEFGPSIDFLNVRSIGKSPVIHIDNNEDKWTVKDEEESDYSFSNAFQNTLHSIKSWVSVAFSTTRRPITPRSETSNIYDDPQLGSNPNFRKFSETVVLYSNEKFTKGEFVFSPSEKYGIGLDDVGNLVLRDLSDHSIIWSADVEGCSVATMQNDGNFVMRDETHKVIWTTHTSNNPGARLVIDDGGRLSVMVEKTPVWMQGVPRGVYSGTPVSPSLQYPLRGIFYYPWYPETWSVNSKPARFLPDLGKYSSDNASVIEEHIDAMDYAYSDVAIASWWGPGKNKELSRISLLMDKTFALNSALKWTVFYEEAMFRNITIEKIRSDLNYLQKWFVWHPSWAFLEDKPVIFVYNKAGCDVNERWMEAAGADWYVVLKVFKGRKDCAVQPDSYHQYGPSSAYIHINGVSSGVSPGFWRADQETAKLPRLSKEAFCENTKRMVNSGEDWQLVTTFNEAGEGTLVEVSSDNWGSNTKYGYYLDCLHEHH